jgi:hypothetical protein
MQSTRSGLWESRAVAAGRAAVCLVNLPELSMAQDHQHVENSFRATNLVRGIVAAVLTSAISTSAENVAKRVKTRLPQSRVRAGFEMGCQVRSSSSSALAPLRSAVANPSVNPP